MSDTVSHETECFTLGLAAQIEARRAGRRKKVRHGGRLCSSCLAAPPKPGQRQCAECHRLSQIDYRRRQTAKNKRNAAIAAGVMAGLAAAENQELSKGHDNERYSTKGQLPATSPGKAKPSV